MTLDIHILDWNMHENVAGLNQLMESQPSSLEIKAINIKTNDKKKKPAQFRFHSKRPHTDHELITEKMKIWNKVSALLRSSLIGTYLIYKVLV